MSEFVFSTSMEILNTALKYGLTECSECGETFEVDIPSGLIEKLKRVFFYKQYYRVNISAVQNFEGEAPKAYCSHECATTW